MSVLLPKFLVCVVAMPTHMPHTWHTPTEPWVHVLDMDTRLPLNPAAPAAAATHLAALQRAAGRMRAIVQQV